MTLAATTARIVLSAEDRASPAFKAVQNSFAQTLKSADLLRSAVGGLAAGFSVAGVLSYAKGLAQLGTEVDRLAKLSNVNVEQFQQQAFAAERAGISSEKYADILKDVQDKVGDFVQNGAGPLKDFFDNIAPKVGVTAEQFRKLGGADALQLYVSSLQKANLSQSELTFYMEAIASDSALLLPLLKDNGAEMKRLGDQAQRLGLVLDQNAIASVKQFDDQLRLLSATSAGFGRTVALPIITGLNSIAEQFRLARDYSSGFFESLFRTGTANAQEKLVDLEKQLNELLEARQRYVRAGSDTRGLDQAIAGTSKDINLLKEFQRRQRLAAIDFGADNQSSAEAARLGLTGRTGGSPAAGGGNTRTTRTGSARGGASSAASAEAAELRRIIELAQYRNSVFDEEFEKEERARLVVEDRIKSAREMLEAIQQETYLMGLSQDQREQAVASFELERAGVVAGTEAYTKFAEAIREAVGARQAQQKAQAEQKAREEVEKQESEDNKRRSNDLAASIEDGILNGFRKGQTLGDIFVNELQSQFAKTVLRPIISPIAEFGNALIGGLFKGLLPTFDGGGYTGNGPRAGGLDGKGGYLAMLHPRETVLDHTKGQGGGTTIIINATVGDVASQSMVVAGMQTVRAQILGDLQRSARYGGALA